MNELALLAERVGADIEQVRLGIGSDPRIGFGFLYAGCGYGGSCFPKDVKALIHTGRRAGHAACRCCAPSKPPTNAQKRVLIDKIVRRFGDDLAGRRFALWGLAFKPNTDDMREAPSRVVIAELLARGASVQAYDPIAMHEARRVLGELAGAALCRQRHGARCSGADALVIVTEWKEFRSPDFERIKATLRQPVIFDGRNMFAPATVRMPRASNTTPSAASASAPSARAMLAGMSPAAARAARSPSRCWWSSTRRTAEVLLIERADKPGYWQSVTGSKDRAGRAAGRDLRARGRGGNRHRHRQRRGAASRAARLGAGATSTRSIRCGATAMRRASRTTPSMSSG